MKEFLVLAFFGLISISSGQFVQPGQCGDINNNIGLVENFKFEDFKGQWYEVARSSDYITNGDCGVLNFNDDNSTGIAAVEHSSVLDNFLQEQSFTASLSDGTAKFTLNISGRSVDYWILLLNPTICAVAYSCENINNQQRRVHLWQLGREPTLNNELMTRLINTTITDNFGVTIDQLDSVSHSEFSCYTLPPISQGLPVIVGDQCNPNLPVVQNFDVSRLTGTWHEISAYNAADATNTCTRVQFSLQNDRIFVEDSQVWNKTLEVNTGYALVNDGAKLKVVYENQLNGAEQDRWVLSTDYENYAILYSCVNLPNNQRRLYSWIIGRQHVLLESVKNAVNDVVDSYIELNRQYYKDSDHSNDACFYYPEGPGPVVLRGSCDLSIPVKQNLDAGRYLELWHDIESYPSTYQSGTCSNAFYSLNADGKVDVKNTQVINGTLDIILGTAEVVSDDGSAKLDVTFPIENTNFTIVTNYWVIETDYDSFSLVYSCSDLPSHNKMVFGWKLSRTKSLPAETLALIDEKMSSIDVLDQRFFVKQDQSEEGCFYIPEPQPGVPVVFPGQCDENIPVVQNFNLEQFKGVWYEVAAYPKEEQPGQCINHDFTVNGNSFSLESSQIVDQFLVEYGSSVTFTSNDTSAKLNIALNSNGTVINIPYWILDTDYNDYALAYSCVNIKDDFRGIWSWKLSRSKVLSPAASNRINEVIAPIEVLDNKYYEPIDQSDKACFFLPELEAGEPVILVGQCDSNLPVVQNFNVSRYLGTWRMIESYPSVHQIGSCNTATYSLGIDNVIVYNTEVRNQSLSSVTGSATLATTDGSGKLLVQIPAGSNPTDYWILDTDYDSYSLVYSCVNINNEQRQVFSWKLSRTRGLSDDALASMNEVINNVDVLNNKYYEQVNQSDESCFYYPEPDQNPVVFRGQCDLDIPVETSFDVIKYLGPWYDVASYPSTFQKGTCGKAYYSANDDGTVQVYNTQVLNATLDSIDGIAELVSNDAKLKVTFPILGTNFTITTNYWVLSTDYTSYALVYTCENIDDEHRMVFSWKLSRSNTLSPNATEVIDKIIDSIPVLDERYYKPKDHSTEGCFYYPEPDPDTPVEFPGTCDKSIPVVKDFDLEKFSGVWYEIETYPKEETDGQCLTHNYTVNGNSLSLISSQVVDKYLDVYSSQVIFDSNDGSAQLKIVLNGANNSVIEIPFWIIDTDYTSYALAYSCVSYNNDKQGVWSWKLSRNKQMSQEANDAISYAMSNITVIDERYFLYMDQSPAGCFYLPELQPNEPVILPGQCDPNVPVVPNFDVGRFLDVWRLIDTYYTEFQTGDCADAKYTLYNGEVLVYNTQVINETLDTITGTAAVASDDGSAKLLVTFPNTPGPSDYWVLSTDYENYALIYSCVNINDDERRVFSWKLGRTRQLSENATLEINKVIDSIDVLDHRYYQPMKRDEESCFYYPEVTDSGPIVFRGQCDETIPVVENFDVARYLNTWYDIESYPQLFQLGTCPDATYSVRDDGSVNVYNTQVVDKVLDTITGFAVPVSDDGSAKLKVSFPILNTNVSVATNYWVLATDYDSYSLVYSCQNIDDEYRRVSSWKLSRTKALSAEANRVINNITDGIKVLDSRYYLTKGHSEEDCFFYPDNNGGPVYLEGECDDNIKVVDNFDLNAFVGEWHEVSRFPSELQNGDCSSSTFAMTSQGLVTLTQNIVYNEKLMTMTGSVVAHPDGKGILDASLSSDDGTIIDIRFYVLGTDYKDYAVLYSCNDTTNGTKQVYSWKLAKSRSGYSDISKEEIDKLVTNTSDLYEGYYQTIDQSNDKCFYYPEFEETPQAIVFTTPCEDITAMADFNATAYLGKWYEIAKYPQIHELGTCNQAEYSLGADGVIVYNTEVVNQTLSSITGVAVPVSDGVLEVTFVIAGQEVKRLLTVLDTDYTSYSLVYSCQDLPSGESQVSSWKLSRDKSLSPQANAIINDIIEDTRGLLEKFYTYTSQSDEDCFYIPEVEDNKPVVFRGQCEDISGVQNFDLDKYAGWWHEIERYSESENEGECIGTQFLSVGSGYQSIDTRVFGLNADVVTSTVTATNDGKITKVVNGQVVQEYIVLATDYQTYSLIYACKDIEKEKRQVWSAKYSKQRSLTASAQSEMASVIESNKVLYPQFYKSVDQSDDACFHYPDIVDNRVVLPGQCDDNIPVQGNFDPVQYTGTWYQMERYPQIHEHKDSSCVGANYELNSDTGVVTLVNWEVINDILETIEGTAVITSTNGDAKLSVTLPIVGTDMNVTTSLYVLKTDYVVYSLVYSCSNLNEFERLVSVWKLSRTRSMPASGTAAINEYMATRKEIHQPYFISVYHDEACPEPSGSIVIYSSSVVILLGLVLQRLL